MTTLPASTLCRVVVAAEQIFSDGRVKEAIQDVQRAIEGSPSISTALGAFSESIAPVLLSDAHRQHTTTLLQALEKDASGGPGTIRDLFTLFMLDENFSILTSSILRYGAAHVLSAIYRFGTPPVMKMLPSLLEVEAEQQEWQVYMGDMTGSLVRALYGKNASRIPLYSDIMKKKNTVTDTRSGNEIVADLAAKLRKRKEKRKHEDLRNDHR